MPLRILCAKCGSVLYEGDDLKSPLEVIQEHNFRCSYCGVSLSFSPEKFDESSVEIIIF